MEFVNKMKNSAVAGKISDAGKRINSLVNGKKRKEEQSAELMKLAKEYGGRKWALQAALKQDRDLRELIQVEVIDMDLFMKETNGKERIKQFKKAIDIMEQINNVIYAKEHKDEL